jgi:hypothetical protein
LLRAVRFLNLFLKIIDRSLFVLKFLLDISSLLNHLMVRGIRHGKVFVFCFSFINFFC